MNQVKQKVWTKESMEGFVKAAEDNVKELVPKETEGSLGCGKKFGMHTSTGFICGVADAWGQEKLCKNCDLKMRASWDKTCVICSSNEGQEAYADDGEMNYICHACDEEVRHGS